MAIRIQVNGKTRDISLDDFLNKSMQDLIAEDIGYDMDELGDFESDFSDSNFIDIEGTDEVYPISKDNKKKEK